MNEVTCTALLSVKRHPFLFLCLLSPSAWRQFLLSRTKSLSHFYLFVRAGPPHFVLFCSPRDHELLCFPRHSQPRRTTINPKWSPQITTDLRSTSHPSSCNTRQAHLPQHHHTAQQSTLGKTTLLSLPAPQHSPGKTENRTNCPQSRVTTTFSTTRRPAIRPTTLKTATATSNSKKNPTTPTTLTTPHPPHQPTTSHLRNHPHAGAASLASTPCSPGF